MKNGIHQIEIIFRCTQLYKDQNETVGSQIDIGMVGMIWLSEEEIKYLRVYSSNDIFDIIKEKKITYLYN